MPFSFLCELVQLFDCSPRMIGLLTQDSQKNQLIFHYPPPPLKVKYEAEICQTENF